ncbi:hypothetical protein IPM65_02120 [Candidatus Roizmanbacteria bacterium]|nr:MAG: hypothetical protein IPM65_02120 [Candidatus Roizmanbacteria bacterium]
MSLKKMMSPFFVIILLGIFIRLSIMFVDFSFDVLNHISWAKDVWNRGLYAFYETRSIDVYGTEYPNYPPLAIGLFAPFYPLYQWLFGTFWQLNLTVPAFPSVVVIFMERLHFQAGLMKIPAILSDFGLAWILAQITEKLYPKRKHLKVLVMSLILLHPTFFYNSAFFGQIDSIPLFLMALAVYFSFFVKKPYWSFVILTAAVLVKPTVFVFLPVFMISFFSRYGLKTTLKGAVISILLFWLAFQPMAQKPGDPLYPFILYKEGILDTQSIGAVTNAAYNAWALYPPLFFVPAETSLIGSITYGTVGTIIAGGFILALSVLYWKNRSGKLSLFIALSLCAFASFLFLTKMHERYLILILPFLLVPAVKYRSIMYAWGILSLISFLNLYKSWSVPKVEPIVQALSSDPIVIILSAINVLLFLYVFRFFVSHNQKASSAAD